jgi:serine/threonine protein phosphatase PrpC
MKLHGALDVAGLSDIGLQRKHNEDALDYDASAGIMVLADGMGGHLAGEVASEIAVLSILAELKYTLKKKLRLFNVKDTQPKNFAAEKIKLAVENTNALIYNISQTQPRFTGMGTTLLLSVFTNNQVFVGHIGDSRMYRFRAQSLHQLTEDHSIVQAQINAGWMTLEEAKLSASKNLVTRALGLGEEVELTLNSFEVEAGDIYLLCSDGLTDVVNDTAIAEIISQPESTKSLAESLIHLANAKGGRDNVSVILVKVKALLVEAQKKRFKNLLNNIHGFLRAHF